MSAGSGSVDAEEFIAPSGPAVQYWIAALGALECGSVQVAFRPSDPTDELTVHMTGETGPPYGCGEPGAPPTTGG